MNNYNTVPLLAPVPGPVIAPETADPISPEHLTILITLVNAY